MVNKPCGIEIWGGFVIKQQVYCHKWGVKKEIRFELQTEYIKILVHLGLFFNKILKLRYRHGLPGQVQLLLDPVSLKKVQKCKRGKIC